MLLSTTATAPSCQSWPFMKNSATVHAEPAQAKPAICHLLCPDRSTNAPTTGSRNALVMVAKLVR